MVMAGCPGRTINLTQGPDHYPFPDPSTIVMEEKTIFVLEDEPLTQQVLHRFIGLLGYRVESFARGADALKQAKTRPPDAVVADNNLEDMTGLEFYRLLRDAGFPVPALLISAYELNANEMRSVREAGFRGMFRKPFSFDQFKKAIHRLFRQPLFLRRDRFVSNIPSYDLRPKQLAQQVFRRVFRQGLDHGGHVHFHLEGHSDHLVLLCNRRAMGKVIAKSSSCKNGECIKWEHSSFGKFSSDTVLSDLSGAVNLVRVDSADYEMSWPTLADFLCWLELNQ
jgi:CheY-like chemotaxis protein